MSDLDLGQLGLGDGARAILSAVWIPGRDRGGRWLDEVRDQLDLDPADFRQGLGELADRGLISVGRPTSRGVGMVKANGWIFERELQGAAR